MKNLYQLVSLCLLFGLSHCQTSEPERVKNLMDVKRQLRPILQVGGLSERPQMHEEVLSVTDLRPEVDIVKMRTIAFTARMPSHSRTPYFRDIFPFEYKDVVSNVGRAYDPMTGIFKAPFPGVYYFTFNSYLENGIPSTCGSLFRNQEEIVSWFGHNLLYPMSESNSAVLELRAGDSVFVAPWHGCKISEGRNYHSSFSGFLLYPSGGLRS